jgi:uncharacterized membrane protein YhaH (DUF805 family)
MNWGHYLFSFSGRINRAKAWLFVLVAIGFGIVAFTLIASAFGLGHIANVMQRKEPPTVLSDNAVALAVCALVGVAYLVFIFSAFAVVVKRLHDRNKSAWWLVIFYLIPFILNGYRFSTVMDAVHRGEMAYAGNPIATAAGGIAALISLWAFVEIYCLSGTNGDNRYGPDPLAGRR